MFTETIREIETEIEFLKFEMSHQSTSQVQMIGLNARLEKLKEIKTSALNL